MAKKNRMEVEKFMPLYYKAMADGMNRDDFAEMIGVEVDTVYQRVYELMTDHPELVEQGMRQLPRKTNLPLRERVLAAWASANKQPAPEKTQEPKPEPKAKVKTDKAAAVVKAATKSKAEEPTAVVAPVPNPEITDELSKLLGN
jgi:hypothetical protein